MKTALESIVAITATIFTFAFGAWDTPLVALLVFISLDYATGVMCAFKTKKLSSAVGAKGLLKKAMILVVLIVAVVLDRLVGTEWVIRSAACYFYIANEGISIIENAATMGVPVPKKLADVLAQIKGRSNKKDEK